MLLSGAMQDIQAILINNYTSRNLTICNVISGCRFHLCLTYIHSHTQIHTHILKFTFSHSHTPTHTVKLTYSHSYTHFHILKFAEFIWIAVVPNSICFALVPNAIISFGPIWSVLDDQLPMQYVLVWCQKW